MASASSLIAAHQSRPILRLSMANPAPASEMMTINSEACSMILLDTSSLSGSSTGTPSTPRKMPNRT
ncbi:MAG: hypothetical protein P1U53_14745 [Sulfitobacter sp.]|nr:hypothetical protein [Sulfitobacter sp.]